MPGDLRDEQHCRELVDRAVREFGQIDVLVSNAAYQIATMPEDALKSFGAQAPLGRAAQPVELAPFYVFLISQESS